METLLVVSGIVWFLLSFLVGSLAQNKGLGFANGLVISLLFSPIIGFLYVIAATPDPNQQSAQQIYQKPKSNEPWICPKCGTLNHSSYIACQNKDVNGAKCLSPRIIIAPREKKCPQCAEMVKAEARVCRFCQYKFLSDKTCPQCAKVVTSDANFCPFCQHRFG